MRTRIQNWIVLCRWALCVSLREPTPPSPIDMPADNNVEMSWHVFGGEHHEIYLALVKERCERDALGATDEVVARQSGCTFTAALAIWPRRGRSGRWPIW